VTPKVLEKIVWAGANLGGYRQATAALRELAGVDLAGKRVHRVTSQIGGDCRNERALQVEAFRAKTLAERTAANPTADVPALGVVMMDGGRHQRRDHFGQPRTSERKGHWKEDKVGLALSMQSEVFEGDPTPEFPEWLAGAKVVSEIAKLAERDEQTPENSGEKRTGGSPSDAECNSENHDERTWAKAPRLLRREMIASTDFN